MKKKIERNLGDLKKKRNLKGIINGIPEIPRKMCEEINNESQENEEILATRILTKKFPDAFVLTPSGNTAATKLHVVLLWTVYYSQ